MELADARTAGTVIVRFAVFCRLSVVFANIANPPAAFGETFAARFNRFTPGTDPLVKSQELTVEGAFGVCAVGGRVSVAAAGVSAAETTAIDAVGAVEVGWKLTAATSASAMEDAEVWVPKVGKGICTGMCVETK